MGNLITVVALGGILWLAWHFGATAVAGMRALVNLEGIGNFQIRGGELRATTTLSIQNPSSTPLIINVFMAEILAKGSFIGRITLSAEQNPALATQLTVAGNSFINLQIPVRINISQLILSQGINAIQTLISGGKWQQLIPSPITIRGTLKVNGIPLPIEQSFNFGPAGLGQLPPSGFPEKISIVNPNVTPPVLVINPSIATA